MSPLVDTSLFQLGPLPEGLEPDELAEETADLQAMEVEVRDYVESRPWAPPIAELLLAFGVGGILGLYLVKFQRPLPDGDLERWVVTGDMPMVNFETEDAPTPALALQLFCAICQDWADNVMAGADLSQSYPIGAPPTKENAELLLNRVDFIRRELVPEAEPYGKPSALSE